MKLGRCGACDAKDQELARARERENKLLEQLGEVTRMLSAHADTKAHLAAVRAERPEAPERDRPKPKLPPYVNTLSGHAKIDEIRRRMLTRKDPTKPPIAS